MSAAGNVDTATFSTANAEVGTAEKYFRATEAFGDNSDVEAEVSGANSENNAVQNNTSAQRNTMKISGGRNSRRRT